MNKITILGTGAMGTRIAHRLLDADYSVSIYNRTKKHAAGLIDAGATYYATPLGAVKDADVIMSMLTDDDASRSVWLSEIAGAIAGIKKGAIVVESSTLSKEWTDKLSHEFESRKIDFVDAPVVGSRPQAESGGLIYLVGGTTTIVDRLRPELSCLASSVLHVGPNGSGTQMKLAVNAFFAVQVSALSEIIAMLENVGINKQETISLFNQLPTTSPAMQGIGNLIAANNYDPLFPISLVEKDFSYMLAMASQHDAKLPVVTAAHGSYQQALEAGLGESNIAGVIRLYSIA